MKNNGTRTFSAAIANISDHVHAPKQAGPTAASMNESSVVDNDCTSWMPEVAQTSQWGLGRSPGSQAERMAYTRAKMRTQLNIFMRCESRCVILVNMIFLNIAWHRLFSQFGQHD